MVLGQVLEMEKATGFALFQVKLGSIWLTGGVFSKQILLRKIISKDESLLKCYKSIPKLSRHFTIMANKGQLSLCSSPAEN